MKHSFIKNISCDNALKCSDALRTKIENKLNIKLMKNKETDTVDGSITILHTNTKHEIIIETSKTKQQIEDTLK